MRTDYAEVFRDARAVDKYEHVIYARDSYSSAVNRRQRAYLRDLVRRSFLHRRPVQHDFACGTGRAIQLLSGLVRAAHGYDTSPAMLTRARVNGVYASLHEVAQAGPVPQPATIEPPAIVTVFRLLLNAPEEVRDRAIAFAARALPDPGSGLLVVENHGSARSLRHLARRRQRTNPWFSELSDAHITDLLARHGFEIVERRGFTVLTRGWYRVAWLRPAIRRADDLLCHLRLAGRVATNVLYVARRTAG